MKKILRQRALAVVAGGAVALSTAVAITPTASAAPNSYAYSAARWLDDQLTDGLVHNPNWGGFDDYGLSLDVFFTLNDLDARPAAQTKIIDAVSAYVTDYVTFEEDFYPGSAGKLAVAVEAAGGDATDVNGTDLIGEIETLTDDETGEIDPELTYGGVGQAWATRALIAGGSTDAGASVTYLLTQQCPDGSFKQTYGQPCPALANIDSTAFAVEALLDAKAAGNTGVDAALASATKAMLAAQAQDGSFIGDGVPNTNSTGKAAKVLALVGQNGAAGSAAAWIVGNQVTAAVAEDSKLANELGAIAYDSAALSAGKADGITNETRDQWIRATTQAAAGVQAQLAPAKVTVTSARYVAAGRTVKVAAKGLAAGEKYTIAISGGRKSVGTVPANGSVSVNVKAPAGNATRTIAVTGSRANRTGATTVPVLAKRNFSTKVAKKKLKKKKVQRVVVRGFTPREPVRVYYRGKLIKRGTASTYGNFSHKFRVGTKVGKTKVTVYGAYANRKGVKNFRVVK